MSTSVPGRGASPALPIHCDDPLRGIALIVAAMASFSCSDAISKYLTGTVPPLEIAWLRYAVFVVIMAGPALFGPGRGAALRSRQPWLQLVRGLGMLGSTVFFISGLRTLPLAQATATSFVSPIFVTALSIPILGEVVGVRRWAAVVVGLVGVIIVVRPGGSSFEPAALLPVLSASCWATTLVVTRKTSGTDGATTALTYSAVIGFAILSALMPFEWVALGWREILLGTAMAIASTTAQWLVVLAYRYAGAALLAPFSYSQLIWSTTLGFVVFGAIPDLWTFVGAAIIIASGLYTAHRERVRARGPA